MSAPRQLFGGAITAVLPDHYIDASTLRDVPDTQEVFLDSRTSASLIIEVLKPVDAEDPSDAIRAHFDAAAHDNDAEPGSAVVYSVYYVLPAVVLAGSQRVRKTGRSTPDEVRVFMALVRVPAKRADLVITAHAPVSTSDGGALGPEGVEEVRKLFETFVASLKIMDYGLFA